MAEEMQKFDARLKEGVEYFEKMLKVMPDDRTTLEFLAVAYPQMGETLKAEAALSELARVLVKEGDLKSAEALLPRLEEFGSHEAQAMALKVRASIAPMPELKAEEAPPARADEFASAVESEAALAEKLGENDLAGRIRALQPGEQGLVSALYLMEKDSSEACEAALARLSDEYGEPPVPVDAFAPLLLAAPRLPAKLMALRGVVAFARIGDVALVAHLSPNDSLLHRAVTAALGLKARFFLAEPSKIEKAVETLVAAESGEGGKEGA